MVKLDKVIQSAIDKLNVDFDNILAALETALKYRNLNGFEVLSEIVISRIKALVSSLSNEDLNQFYDEYMDDNPDLVRSLVRLVANKKIKLCEARLRPDCDNCRVEKVNCRDGEDVDVLPHVGMKITWRNGAKEARFVKGVSAKNTVTYEYESQLLSRSYPNDFIPALYSCK